MSAHFRRASLLVLVCGLGGVGLWATHAAAPPISQPSSAKKKAPRPLRDRDFRAALNRVVDFPENDDPKTNLGEVLDKIAHDYGVLFEFNETAFRFEMLNDVRKTPVTERDALPALKQTTLAKVLRRVLQRVPVPSGATYLIRRDAIEITTTLFVAVELKLTKWKADPEEIVFELPVVLWEEFRQEPLDAILERIAEANGVTVLLDPRASRRAGTKITATLRNVSLDVALQLLADMADLALVKKANAYYVTLPEKAARLTPSKLETKNEKDEKP